MKILWVSNAPWASTGYGVQTKLFYPRIQALGHEIQLMANWGLQGAVLNLDEKTRVYPIGFDRHGNDIIASHAAHLKADVVITLYDSWVFHQECMSRVRWVPWMPVDNDPLPLAVERAMSYAYQPIAYSKFGYEKLKEKGFDPRYVPHGVDLKVYKPGDRAKARGTFNLPDDVFMAAMVAANKGAPSRKCFAEVMYAWRHFIEDHPGSVLYIHTHAGPEMVGLNLPELMKLLDMPKGAIMFCDPYWNTLGFPEWYMADIYRAADVLVNPSMGEGFGLPILEAQACGCPVIVGNWTSMPELLFAGWPVGGQPFYTPVGSWQFVPYINDIQAALEEAWKARGVKALRKKARKGALPYDADRVAQEHWKPVLDELAKEVAEGGALEMVQLGGVERGLTPSPYMDYSKQSDENA